MSDHAFWLYWTVFVVAFFVFFIPVEIYGAIRHPDIDTLSAWVWKAIGTRSGWHWWNTPLRLGVLALFLWLAEHFTFGWF